MEDNNQDFDQDLTPEKKKRGRKKKEDLLRMEMENKKQQEELKAENKEPEIDPRYYGERNSYKNILLTAFLTRWRNVNYNHIKDNDNIIVDGSKILEEVKKMSDMEYGHYYKMLLKNLNGEDIFETNDYFF